MFTGRLNNFKIANNFKMSSINDIVQVQEVASPMTNLANSFGKTLRVRRKLTFSESSEKPKKGHDNILHGKFKYSYLF